MKLRLLCTALAACIVAVSWPAAAWAQAPGTLVTTIGEQRITLPLPPDFVEPEGPATMVTDMLRDALSENYRLIALRVPKSYVDGLRAHDPAASMSRYCTILSYRKYEASGMSPELFAQIRKALREQADKVLKLAESQGASAADRMSRDVARRTGDATTSLKIGTSRSLGVIAERPSGFALATIGPVSISSKHVNESGDQVTVVAVALVHGKPVNANFYADYHSQADLAWAEDQARDWLGRIAELNP